MSNAETQYTPDKRKLERCKVGDILEVFDIHSERQMGRVADISVEGLMLISQTPIEVNRIFQLLIPLPMELEGCSEIRLGVESLWTRESNDGTQHWTGFHVICISDQDRDCIERMLSRI